MSSEAQRIIALQVENIKRVVALRLKPDGGLVVVGGDNAQGKSSVLDAIEYAFGGGNALPSKPIKDKARKARVIAETQDYTVTRTFTEKGSYLTVTTKDGARYPQPQALLDKMVGDLSFDPLAFTRKRPAEQAALVRELAGVDTTEVDKARSEAFETRTELGRDEKKLAAQLEAAPFYEDVPDEPVSIESIAKDIEANRAHNAANQKERDRIADLRREGERKRAELEQALANAVIAHKAAVDRTESLKAELNKAVHAEETLANAKAEAEGVRDGFTTELDKGLAEVELDLEGLVDKPVDELVGRLANCEQTNEKVRANRERNNLSAEHDAVASHVTKLTATIEECDRKKKKMLAEADLPVEGLAYDDDGVTYNGIPFDQCSSAEQLRVSVAMTLAMNPALRVMLIRDGSLLDETSMKLLAELAATHDAQVWVERVSKGEEVSVVISDGMVDPAYRDAPIVDHVESEDAEPPASAVEQGDDGMPWPTID